MARQVLLLAVELVLLSVSCWSDNKSLCSAPLGMEDSRIPDENIKSWSPLLRKYHLAKARLNGVFAWCTAESLDSLKGPYLQITLDKPQQITGIATRSFNNFWVTGYYVEYKVGDSFRRYKDPTSRKETIRGNSDEGGLVTNTFTAPFVTQTIRVIPVAKHGLACMTMELYGCNKSQEICSAGNNCSTKPTIPTTNAASPVTSKSSTNKINPTTTSGTVPQVHTCRAPSLPLNLRVLRPQILKHEFNDGEFILYACTLGYYRFGGSPIQKCGPQGWSKMTLQCKPKTCGDPGVPLNGKKVGYIYTFQSKVFYNCDPGYTLLGPRYRECQANQTWSGSIPRCEVLCSDPGQPVNGKRIGDDFRIGKVVKFKCNARYNRRGPRSVQCRGGNWDDSIPTCIECNKLFRYARNNAHAWRRNRVELKFPEARKITGLTVSVKLQTKNWKFLLRHKTNGQWITYAEQGKPKAFRVRNGTLVKKLTLAEPIITRQVLLQVLSRQTVSMKQVTVQGCKAPSDSSDCILVGSKVWIKGKSTRNEKRTIYHKNTVKGIKNKKVIVSTSRIYTTEAIPDVIATESSLRPGLSVIAVDSGKYYSGSVRRKVGKSVWEIQSHDVTWRSQTADIRVIENPEYCF